jgi:hypothetical protein
MQPCHNLSGSQIRIWVALDEIIGWRFDDSNCLQDGADHQALLAIAGD